MSIPAKLHINPLASSRTLVVGGSSGIGAAVVSATLANGGSVHISSSNPERIDTKIAEFKALYPGASVTGTAANLSDETTLEASVKHVLDEAIKALGGPLNHIIYTAGDAFGGTALADLNPSTYFKGWNVRYLGPLFIAKLLTTHPGTYLKVDASSSFTLTSGVLVHKPIPGVAHVIGCGGAIEGLTRGLAVDLAPVRVNVVAPGAIRSEMLEKLPEAALESFAKGTLVKRIGAGSECAEGYLFSLRSAFLTGEVIHVNGGAFFV